MPQATELFDIICVGLGTTALALAASLADDPASKDMRVLFIDKQHSFSWPPACVLPQAAVASPLLCDLITSQNPRSEFTFMNFLHRKKWLVQYTNASQIRPSRALMAAYFEFVADQIQSRGWISYGTEAQGIVPFSHKGQSGWSIDVCHLDLGNRETLLSRVVVLATGAACRMPSGIIANRNLFMSSHDCSPLLNTFLEKDNAQSIAVVGADQEAAEIFTHLHLPAGRQRATMYIQDSMLMPEDHTPLTSPQSLVESSSTVPPELRQRLGGRKSSNGPKVALKTLERLHEKQYSQEVKQPDPSKRRFVIQNHSEIVGSQSEADSRLRLVVKDTRTGAISLSNRAFDGVIVCMGYDFVDPLRLLSPQVAGRIDGRAPTVDRHYRLNLRRGTQGRGSVFVLGSLEDQSRRKDDLQTAAEKAQCAARGIMEELRKGSGSAMTTRVVEDVAVL